MGVQGWTPRGRWEWGRERGGGRGVGQRGGAATAGSGSPAVRAGGAAWPRRATYRTGEGPGG
jgi:hypothetical protein